MGGSRHGLCSRWREVGQQGAICDQVGPRAGTKASIALKLKLAWTPAPISVMAPMVSAVELWPPLLSTSSPNKTHSAAIRRKERSVPRGSRLL